MRNLFILLSLVYSSFAVAEVRLISVTGLVEKSFQPDIVRFTVNVWGKGDSAKKAQANNQTQYEIVKKSIESFKVKKEDLKTVSYYLNPEYVYDQKTNRNNISGYTANQAIMITLRKIDDAGPFIDSLTTNSKNNTGGVDVNQLTFDLDKRVDEENALMSAAVEKAYSQAEVLAKAAKVKLKGIYRLAPRGTNSPSPMYEARALMMADGGGRAKGEATQFMSGEVKVSAEVSADYLVE